MKTSYILMLVTIISKLFGLIREQALARFFGTAMAADVFLVAFQIPMTFTNVVSGATANGYIPIYDKVKTKENKEKADEFTSNLVNIAFIATLILSVIGIIFAEPLVKLMAYGFNKEELELGVFMTRAGLVSLAATSSFSIFKAYLQINRKFVISVSHAIFMNIIIIASMYLSYKTKTAYLGYGIAIAFIFQYIIFLPYIRKTGYKQKLKINLKDEYFKEMLKMIIPVLISTSVIELNFIISKSLASSLYTGAISTLNYAYKLQSFVTGIVITSITTAVYPEMARLGARKDKEGLKNQTSEALFTMSLLVIPASIGLFLFSVPIVKLLFQGGAFGKEDSIKTATVLAFYAIGIIGIGVREILSRVCYSQMDTKTPVINSVIMVAVNIVLSVVLSKIWGIKGLALATSISFIAGAILIYIPIRNKLGKILKTETLKDIIKIIISTAVMGAGSKTLFNIIEKNLGSNLSLIASILIAGIIYIAMLLILKPSAINKTIEKIKNRNK